MGILVSAAVAGRLVDRHERIVRGRIERGDLPNARKNARGAWQVDVDDLAAIPGWVVDREELARLELRARRGHSGLVARVEALEARVRQLEARIAAVSASPSTHGGNLAALPHSDDLRYPKPSDLALGASGDVLPAHVGLSVGLSPDARHILSDYPAAAVTLADRGSGAPLSFAHKTAAARWLSRHGVKELTPKSWPGWPPDELTPAGVLRFALDIQNAATARNDWRVTWRLSQCSDSGCVCRELLDG